MSKQVEFFIHDLDKPDSAYYLKGREWRLAHRLVKECEEGIHPSIASIERVIRKEIEELNEWKTLYERIVTK